MSKISLQMWPQTHSPLVSNFIILPCFMCFCQFTGFLAACDPRPAWPDSTRVAAPSNVSKAAAFLVKGINSFFSLLENRPCLLHLSQLGRMREQPGRRVPPGRSSRGCVPAPSFTCFDERTHLSLLFWLSGTPADLFLSIFWKLKTEQLNDLLCEI